MSNEHESAAAEFARRLAGLTPTAALTRDRVLYEAGRNAGRKEARPWRYAASVITVGMIGMLAFETLGRNSPPMASSSPRERIERQTQAPPPPTIADQGPQPSKQSPLVAETTDYLRLRDLIVQRGVDAWPRTAVARTSQKEDEPRTAPNGGGDGAWWRRRIQQMGGTSS